MQASAPILRYLLAGNLFRDFLIFSNNKTALDIPGGDLLYTAAGLALWDENIGLCSYVNEDYPIEWLNDFTKRGFDIRGIQIGRSELDQRRFIAYTGLEQPSYENPMSHFARISQPFPKAMLGYDSDLFAKNTYSIESFLKFTQIPEDYYDATAAHISPLPKDLQIRMSSVLRQKDVMTISLMAADEYMDAIYFDIVPLILKGVTAFICRENQALNLFKSRTSDLNEITEALAAYGVEFVVIEKLNQKYIVYDRVTNKHFEVPAYPVDMVDITGVTAAFCGGFLAGLRENHDPKLAALYGSISASFASEGGNAFFGMDALPELVQARYERIKHQVSVL